ncbi:Oidioi.mRNA.OKI2018_I69.chr2.g4555.t2.cds [Oikopleura dioica]|uniref:Oidioi.mRNA.OKI2018_I69.chr2.g4555.t2.cds n=1 Tax=Oikopleura dioica TaxID=34765 RepID=A0ABN7SXT1_OIKDI|nr:Oidioi.mRNA.OKI2018_I69.chr2.g4555.t2.cds [Oikopleura dioica]
MVLKNNVLVSLASAGILSGLENDKRYNQLIETMTMANENFSAETYWAYGCNCLMGDGISQNGHGPAIDEIDTTCKKYKDCIKCVKMEFGEECINNDFRYRIRQTDSGKITCKDDGETCKRAICECDKMFAESHALVADQYNQDYHMFYSMIGWNPEEQCVIPGPSSTPQVNQQCCGPAVGPKSIFNTATGKKCCADGTIQTSCDGEPVYPEEPY